MSPVAASERARRLLAVVPWIAAHDGVAVDEVCERFGIDRRQLLDDLTTLSFVGVAPYTPDLLVEVVIEEDRVWIHLPQAFDRPLRLTRDEAVGLLVAGRAAGQLDAGAAGPLARALEKLAGALGSSAIDQVDIELGVADREVLTLLRQAIAERRAVEIDYYAFGRDERRVRVVEPHEVGLDDGWWYVSGYCRTAADERVFRVDRIQAIRLLEERFPSPERPAPAQPSLAGVGSTVVLELEPGAAWVCEHHPILDHEDLGDGRVRVRLAVAERPWLERLLCTIGADGRVVEGPPELSRAGRDAAERILGRYRDASVR